MKHTLLILAISASLFAEGITYFKVQKVKSSDVLNIREKSDYESKKISTIPFNAQCVKSYGCGKDIDLVVMMDMQEEEVAAFLSQAKEEWCYVEQAGTLGWVNNYYLAPSTKECK